MNPKKLKEKDRRRARKLADQAWEAVENGNLDLAERRKNRSDAARNGAGETLRAHSEGRCGRDGNRADGALDFRDARVLFELQP